MGNTKKTTQQLVMPMVALRGLVLFPKMVLHFDIGRPKSVLALNAAMTTNRQIFLVAQQDIREDDPDMDALYEVGVVGEVKQIIKLPDSGFRVMVEGLYRAKVTDVVEYTPYRRVEVKKHPIRGATKLDPELVEAGIRVVKELFQQYVELSPKMPREVVEGGLLSEDPQYLTEFVAGNLPLPVEDKQEILEESNLLERLQKLAVILDNENNILGYERDLYEKVKSQMDKNQREYFLREQLKVVSNELGEGESVAEEIENYLKRFEQLPLADEHKQKLSKEANRLAKMPSNSQEAGVIRGYLDACVELPWSKSTEERVDVAAARKQLNKDHYGMDKVKERILEFIAVRKLAPDIKGQIICLVGPPGVGKTSIATSIAKALNRNYVRMSLGGVRDEAEIRGHRKTYVGSMPGRIMASMKQAGSNNPLMLLDEIDKLGSDYKGDPAAALLEVLDSEQNHSFRDHFIELPFDLSKVMFIATANNRDTIPAPLLDRMEIIELSSYTRQEKYNIAKKHLIPKQLKRHGLTAKTAKIDDSAVFSLVDFYTREAGVRSLEREIGSLCRKIAKKLAEDGAQKATVNAKNIGEYLGAKRYRPDELLENDEIGVTNGLAWTSVGGEMLQVEVAVLEGSGKIELTGSLGDVMKESAHAAVSYIRSNGAQLSIDSNFYKTKDLHIHVPEGAVPKDGPSAGITICTALVSALTNIPVRRDVAMTGEITLRGRVLPIGGLKEKTMAAYRAGVKTIVIPKDNAHNLEEVDPVVKDAVEFVIADHIKTVLDTALIKPSNYEGIYKAINEVIEVANMPVVNQTVKTIAR